MDFISKNLEDFRHVQTENILKELNVPFQLSEVPIGKIKENIERFQIREKTEAFQANEKGLLPFIFNNLEMDFKKLNKFPAILVIKTKERFEIIDGRHRHFVIKNSKTSTIPSYIIDESTPEAVCLGIATRLNDIHGTPNDSDLKNRKETTLRTAVSELMRREHEDENFDRIECLKELGAIYNLNYNSIMYRFKIKTVVFSFEQLGIKQIEIETRLNNEACVSMYERLSMASKDDRLTLWKTIDTFGEVLPGKQGRKILLDKLIEAQKSKESNDELCARLIKDAEAFKKTKENIVGRDQILIDSDKFFANVEAFLYKLKTKKINNFRFNSESTARLSENLKAIQEQCTIWEDQIND